MVRPDVVFLSTLSRCHMDHAGASHGTHKYESLSRFLFKNADRNLSS